MDHLKNAVPKTHRATELRIAKLAVMTAGRGDFRENETPEFAPKDYSEGKELFGHVVWEASLKHGDFTYVAHWIRYNERGKQQYPTSAEEIRLTRLDKNDNTNPNAVEVPISLVGKLSTMIPEADLYEVILRQAPVLAQSSLQKENGTVFKLTKTDNDHVKVVYNRDGKDSVRAAVLSPDHFRKLVQELGR
ncbi:MAG TPA: hypothetical protein VHS80_04070, partial [Chthoniobacterales bacterium]|nr:hypothetical protein [Chthoniobacterales bacterium]